MRREVRYIGKAGMYGGMLVLVTTYRSLWNPLNWFSGKPLKEARAYHETISGEFVDFNEDPVEDDVAKAINDCLQRQEPHI